MGIQLAQILSHHATHTPERVALVEFVGGERRAHDYASVHRRACSVAAALRGAGLVEGDRVALCAQNGVGYVAGFFGALYAGACVLPVSILAAPAELSHRLRHSRVRAMLVDAPRWALARRALAEVGLGVSLLDVGDLSQAPDGTPRADPPGGAAAMLLYTSGTTGSPKAAVLSHASLLAHTAAIAHHSLRLTAASCVLGVLPLSHSFGMRMTLLAPLYAGARSVLLPRFDAERSLEVMAQEGVDWLPGVPTMFAAWARAATDTRPEIQRGLCAGAPLPESVRRAAEERLGAPILEGYGLTEASFSTLDDADDLQPGEHGVGRPVFGVELRIADADGTPLPAGEVGEICVRGANMMSRYLDDPEATRAVTRDGFLRTGDLGRLDDAGRLHVVDRLKDLILRGGYNVVPAEVEAALARLPGVAEVAVVGRPHAILGEEIVAVICVARGEHLGPAEIGEGLRDLLGRPKRPREVAFVDELPLGPSRKVLRRVLRQQIIDEELSVQDVPQRADSDSAG